MRSALAPSSLLTKRGYPLKGKGGLSLPVAGLTRGIKITGNKRFEKTIPPKYFLHHSWSSPQQEPPLSQESKAGAGARLEAGFLASNNTDGNAKSSFAVLPP